MTMKKLGTKSQILLAALAMITFTTASLHAAEKVDALRVAKIATDYLAKQGAGATQIVSITLDSGTMLNVKQSWVVRWSAPIGADSPREVGLRVRPDGSVARLVEDSHSVSKRSPAAYQIR
jgi:hypothetical protein